MTIRRLEEPHGTCKHGHAWASNLVVTKDGWRRCRACQRKSSRVPRADDGRIARPLPPGLHALSRLVAERALVAHHRAEAAELRVQLGHVKGTQTLVARYKSEYDEAGRVALARLGDRLRVTVSAERAS